MKTHESKSNGDRRIYAKIKERGETYGAFIEFILEMAEKAL